MSTRDGRVVTTTRIVNNGSDARRWHLALMGDGFTEAELGAYHRHCEGFVEHLRRTPPFDVMFPAINVSRIDVASLDSGADDPLTCRDGSTGSGVRARTFFDASFCGSG